MLGKLIKYEMKSQGFMYAGIYIVVMILSIVTFGAYKINTAMGGNPVFSTIYRFAIAGAVIALIAMFIITLVMSILRYRNNLLKDEGYLMHTLPVSAASLHFSKMIASIIWFAADFIVLMLSIGFITGDLKYSWIKKLKMFMSAETDIEKPPENKVSLSAQRNRATQGENLPIVGEKSSQLSYVGILLIFGIFITVILAPKYKRE